ncbi:MAG TPA: Fe-S cluster assembly protein SufD [Parvularcula sp.]|nr:Fe-S cluster assembly protein SufD [Parvularcula sp.]
MTAALTPFESALAARARGFAGLPHRRMEAWKWTDVRAALREDFAPASETVIAPSVFASAGPFEILVMNGRAEWPATAPAGVTVSKGVGAAVMGHPLGDLAAALSDEALVITIEGAVAQPVMIRRVAGAGAVQARALIRLAPAAEATIIESFDGAGAFFSNSATDYDIGAGAQLTRIIRQDAGEAGVETAFAALILGEGAKLDQTALLFGGKLARMETRIAVRGAGAYVSMRSAAALSGARHADQTSLVAFNAVGGETRQIHRAALKDRARGVFQGKFLVARGSQKTGAQMHAGALLLSDMAEANHKPELEIYADDVKCAHGSTAGALDDDALFYMRQRGLSEDAARVLLIEAFLGEVFDGLPAGIEHILRGQLSRRLEAS